MSNLPNIKIAVSNLKVMNMKYLKGNIERLRDAGNGEFVLTLAGWVAGNDDPVSCVTLTIPGCPFGSVKISSSERPDLIAAGIAGKGFSISLPFYFFSQALTNCSLDVKLASGAQMPFVQFDTIVETQFPVDQTKTIVPVLGLGRSGTSALMQNLSLLPEIRVPGTMPYEARLYSYLAARSILTLRTLAAPTVLDLSSSLFFLKNDYLCSGDLDGCKEESAKLSHALGSSAIASLQASFNDVVLSSGNSYYAEKFSTSTIEPLVLAKWLFNVKGLMIIRDLRDVICSTHHYKARHPHSDFVDFTQEAHFVELAEQSLALSQLAKQMPELLIVKYEEMVQDEAKTLDDIRAHLGIPRVRKSKRSAVKQTQKDFIKSHVTASSIDASVGRWRSDAHFNSTQEFYYRHVAEVNTSLGYQ